MEDNVDRLGDDCQAPKSATHPDVVELAGLIKELFTSFKRRLVSYTSKPWVAIPRWDDCWHKAAVECIAEGLSPFALVSALFTEHRDPWPNMLYGVKAIHRTRAYASGIGSERHAQWELQSDIEQLRTRLSVLHHALPDILADETAEFSPLFRFCVAYSEKLEALANLWWPAARLQFKTQIQYRKLFWPWLPESCKKELKGYEPR